MHVQQLILKTEIFYKWKCKHIGAFLTKWEHGFIYQN